MQDQDFIKLPKDKAAIVLPLLIADNNSRIEALSAENDQYEQILNELANHVIGAANGRDVLSEKSQQSTPFKRVRGYSFAAPVQEKVQFILSRNPGHLLSIAELCTVMLEREPDLLRKKKMKQSAFSRNVSSTISQKIKKGIIFYNESIGGVVKYGLLKWKQDPKKTTGDPEGTP